MSAIRGFICVVCLLLLVSMCENFSTTVKCFWRLAKHLQQSNCISPTVRLIMDGLFPYLSKCCIITLSGVTLSVWSLILEYKTVHKHTQTDTDSCPRLQIIHLKSQNYVTVGWTQILFMKAGAINPRYVTSIRVKFLSMSVEKWVRNSDPFFPLEVDLRETDHLVGSHHPNIALYLSLLK